MQGVALRLHNIAAMSRPSSAARLRNRPAPSSGLLSPADAPRLAGGDAAITGRALALRRTAASSILGADEGVPAAFPAKHTSEPRLAMADRTNCGGQLPPGGGGTYPRAAAQLVGTIELLLAFQDCGHHGFMLINVVHVVHCDYGCKQRCHSVIQ